MSSSAAKPLQIPHDFERATAARALASKCIITKHPAFSDQRFNSGVLEK
ncbi:MAG: hypothetical protein RRZ38_14485 [Hafnia sp.]|tara:strand:+ start:898 stop:1044 length:147 start_codon:yes stop_codon:yes gene_type:complete